MRKCDFFEVFVKNSFESTFRTRKPLATDNCIPYEIKQQTSQLYRKTLKIKIYNTICFEILSNTCLYVCFYSYIIILVYKQSLIIST